MFATLLTKLIPLRDYLYLALFAALVGGFFYYRHSLLVEGASREAQAVAAASSIVQAAAQKRVDALNASYQSALQLTREQNAKDQTANAAQHDSDAKRLRDYDAYRHANRGVQSAAGGPGDKSAGDGGNPASGDSVERLERNALSLADSTRAAKTAILSCMAERDSLTGK